MIVKALHHYNEKLVRKLSQEIKDVTNIDSITIVGREMSDYLMENKIEDTVLVPVPSSKAYKNSNIPLVKAISAITDLSWNEAVIRIKDVESSKVRRTRDLEPLSISKHIDSMSLTNKCLDNDAVLLIDNVVTSGNTLTAINEIFLDFCDVEVNALVYANASRKIKRNPQISDNHVICFSGSRNFNDYTDIIYDVLLSMPKNITVIHGCAKGVDSAVDLIAEGLGLKVLKFPADWQRYGKSAGPIRNMEMIKMCDVLIAFWDGKSKGTKNAIDTAKKMNKIVLVFNEYGEQIGGVK